MAETPKFYMPDVFAQWDLVQQAGFKTEQIPYRGGRRQRRTQWPQKIRTYRLRSAATLSQEDRTALYQFFLDRKGAGEAFFFWETSPRTIYDFATGITAGTSGGGDSNHALVPLRGPFWMPETPASPTIPPAASLGGSFVVAGSSLALVSLSTPIPPRGNRYVTYCFNGSNSSASAGTAANTRIAGDQTWAAWVYTPAIGSAMFIAGNETLNASGSSLRITGAGKLAFRTNQAGAATDVATTNQVVFAAQWTHVLISRSGTNISFYVNGALVQTVGGSTNPVVATAAFGIGAGNGAGGATLWHGALNGVRVYSGAVSSTSANDIYSDNRLWDYSGTGLVGNWPLTDGKTATTFADSGPNTYNATISNASDDLWVGGETELTFSSGQTGAVVIPHVQQARQRVTVTFGMDDLPETFLTPVVAPNAIYDIALVEAV